ncbi:MAG TPA: cell wall hydrolase [Methyloceanibacter sp.]|nr:cell wall hydrolase [Methyloceanibacter sp.]
MGRRLPRRVWHTVAALVPLPLIGLGYVAAVPGNPVAFQVELFLSGKGSAYPVTRTADAAPTVLPRQASYLFHTGQKGPRADQVLTANTVTSAGKQLIAASLGGDPVASSHGISGEISRSLKGDRLRPTVSDVALRGPVGGTMANSLLMNASYGSPFSQNFDVDSFKPSAAELAYHPTAEGLAFKGQGESQAEFEERERRCLATAIYFEARGEPVRGQIAVAQVILNRVRSPDFPQTICGVVYQGQMHPGCQFSFTCDGQSDTPRNDEQWALAKSIAKKATAGELWLPEVGYSTYYHANYVSPRWVGDMSRIDMIGRHIFYKKRNEEPYVVDAEASPKSDSSISLTPTLSLVSAAVTNVAGTSTPPTPAMSLGYAAHE